MSGIIACGNERVTRGEFVERAARVATGLARQGVGPGDRVVLILPNSLEFLEITAGAGRLGAYAAPFNWRLTCGEVGQLLDDCEPAAIFVHADLLERLPTAWMERVPTLIVPSPGQDGSGYAAWRDGWEPSQAQPIPAPGSLIYTSGTSGTPKAVQRRAATPEQALQMQAVRARLYRMEADSRCLAPGPLYHTMTNQFAMYAAQQAQHLTVSRKFDAEDFLATVERERITTVALAPVMLVRLLRLPQTVRRRYDVSSLRWVLHAGGPCAPDVKRAVIDWWGPVLGEYYGGTETGALTQCDSHEWLDHPGSCGKPLPEVTLRIVDAQGADVPQGQPGEVYGRLWPNPDFTFRGDPAKRAACSLGDLVSLGDIGYQDSEGYLYLCDRARDMVVSGGVNIYPAEVEAALLTIAGVEDSAVFGVPDHEFGEIAVACVVGADLDGEAIRRQLRAVIADYKVPKVVRIVASLDRDPAGKLRKRELRERYLAELAATG